MTANIANEGIGRHMERHVITVIRVTRHIHDMATTDGRAIGRNRRSLTGMASTLGRRTAITIPRPTATRALVTVVRAKASTPSTAVRRIGPVHHGSATTCGTLVRRPPGIPRIDLTATASGMDHLAPSIVARHPVSAACIVVATASGMNHLAPNIAVRRPVSAACMVVATVSVADRHPAADLRVANARATVKAVHHTAATADRRKRTTDRPPIAMVHRHRAAIATRTNDIALRGTQFQPGPATSSCRAGDVLPTRRIMEDFQSAVVYLRRARLPR